MKKKTIVIAVSILCVVVIGFFIVLPMLNASAGDNTTTQSVTTTMLVKKDISNNVTVNGTVSSESSNKITTSLTSNVTELKVSIGDKVKAGDVLCIFDDAELKANIESLEAQIRQNKKTGSNQININNRALEYAIADQTRQLDKGQRVINTEQDNVNAANNELMARKTKLEEIIASLTAQTNTLNAVIADTSAQDYDSKVAAQQDVVNGIIAEKTATEEAIAELETTLKTAQNSLVEANELLTATKAETDKQIQAAKDAIATGKTTNSNITLQADLDALKEKLKSTVVTSPVSGTVTSIKAEVNAPVNGIIMVIENAETKMINAAVTENDILKLKKGMKVVVSSSAIEDKEYNGTVKLISNVPIIEQAMGTATNYNVEISLDNADDKLLLGMHVKIKIIIDEMKDALVVPYDAIFTEEYGVSMIFVAIPDENGEYTVKSIEVIPGIESDYYQAVSGEGLQEGMLVITSGGVIEGQKVSLLNVDESIQF